MRRILSVLAAVAVVAISVGLAPTPGLAQTAAEAKALRETNAWIEAVGKWSLPYHDVLLRTYDLLGVLSEGSLKAVELGNSGDATQGRAWAQPWAEEQRRALAQIKARLALLSPTPPALKGPGYDLSGVRQIQELSGVIAKLPQAAASQVNLADMLMGRYLDLIVAAAQGDSDATERLAPAYFEMTIAMLRSENHMRETFLPYLRAQGVPQADLIAASMEANTAFIVAYDLFVAAYAERPLDRPKAAATIRDCAGRIETAVGPVAAKVQRAIRDTPPSEIRTKLVGWATSLEETVKTYRLLAGQLRHLAGEIERGAAFDEDAVGAAIDAMVPTLQRISALEKERQDSAVR